MVKMASTALRRKQFSHATTKRCGKLGVVIRHKSNQHFGWLKVSKSGILESGQELLGHRMTACWTGDNRHLITQD